MNQPPLRTQEKSGWDLDTLLQIFNQHRLVFFAFVSTVLAVTLVGSLLSTKQYQAIALIQLMPRAGREIEVNEVVKTDGGGYMESRDRARTQIQIILSRSVREEVLKRYHARGYSDLPEGIEGLNQLKKRISVSPKENTELVEVGVLHSEPELAAVLANLIVDVYAEQNLKSRTDAAQQTKEWLGEPIETYRQALEEASAAVISFKQANNLEDIDEKVNGISTRLQALQTALADTTTKRVLLETKLSSHRQLMASGDYNVLVGMFEDPALQTMARERASIVTESAEVLSRYGQLHPDYQRASDRIKQVDKRIASEVRRTVLGESSLVETLKQQEQDLGAEIDRVKADLLNQQRLQSQHAELKETEMRARELYRSLSNRSGEVDLQTRTRLNDVRIIDRAVPPKNPVKPDIPLNMIMALMVGLAGGLGLVFVRYQLNETILTTADLRRHLDLQLLGIIPSLPTAAKTEKQELYAFNHPRSSTAEAFRGIRSMLQNLPVKNHSNRYLVTSCLPEEGKTFGIIGIASAFAQMGLKVLLVDADLHRPRLHKVFELPEAPGLTDSLVDGEDPGRFAKATPIPRLFLLRCGTRIEDPAEFLASVELERAIHKVERLYDVVLIDTPPAALVSDAMALAKESNGVILLVRRGRLGKNIILKTVEKLQLLGVQILGTILNDVPPIKNDIGYKAKYYDDQPRTGASAKTG